MRQSGSGTSRLRRVPINPVEEVAPPPLPALPKGKGKGGRAGAAAAPPAPLAPSSLPQRKKGAGSATTATTSAETRHHEMRRVPTSRPEPRRGRSWTFVMSLAAGAGVTALLAGAVLLYMNMNKPAPAIPAQTQAQDGNVAPTAPPANAGAPTADLSKPPAGLFDASGASPDRGRFNLPRAITLDEAGNFYVSDTQNFRVQKFDSAGKWLMVFGARGDQDSQFNPMNETATGTGPSGVAVDKAGNIYVADTWNHRIQKFNKDGKFVAKWGSFASIVDPAAATDPDLNSKFWGPRGVAIGPDGNIYVTDTGNKRVLIFDPNGKFVRKIDSGLTKAKADANYVFDKPGEMNEPIGLAVDGEGNVYVADTRNNRIQKFDKDGKPLAQWAVPTGDWTPAPYLEPFLALDSGGNVYATAPTGGKVLKFDPTGKVAATKNKEGDVTLLRPTGIAVGADGTVYVVDTDASRIVNLGKMP